MTNEELAAIEGRALTGRPWVGALADLVAAVAALREERAARLKAEAERDAAKESAETAWSTRWASFEDWKVEKARADAALALLSKAREAWARFAASDRLYHAYPCYHRVPVGGQTLPGAACTCGLADLAKILRTGETT